MGGFFDASQIFDPCRIYQITGVFLKRLVYFFKVFSKKHPEICRSGLGDLV